MSDVIMDKRRKNVKWKVNECKVGILYRFKIELSLFLKKLLEAMNPFAKSQRLHFLMIWNDRSKKKGIKVKDIKITQ